MRMIVALGMKHRKGRLIGLLVILYYRNRYWEH